MDTYSILREFADSWVLLGMVSFFVLAVFWAFRPGSGGAHQDSSEIPFRHDDRPAPETPPKSEETL